LSTEAKNREGCDKVDDKVDDKVYRQSVETASLGTGSSQLGVVGQIRERGAARPYRHEWVATSRNPFGRGFFR